MLILLASIYGFLAFCSAVTMLHPKLRRPENRPVRLAINGWWPSALVAGLVPLGGAPAAVAIFAGLSLWTLREYLELLPADNRHPWLDRLAYATIPLHYAALISSHTALFYGGVLLWTFGVLPLAAAVIAGPASLMNAVPRIQLGLVLTVLGLSHVPALFFLPGLPAGVAGGLAALLLLSVMFGDAFQYFFGKLFGRHRLTPVLSPKKTWEGLIGGTFITGAIAAAAAPLVTPLSPLHGAVLGSSLCLLGLAGDLLVSAIKRGAGVKDTGVVLPGQGGVFDRCDSLLFAAPLFLYGMSAWLR